MDDELVKAASVDRVLDGGQGRGIADRPPLPESTGCRLEQRQRFLQSAQGVATLVVLLIG
jgi:hypothetical protein